MSELHRTIRTTYHVRKIWIPRSLGCLLIHVARERSVRYFEGYAIKQGLVVPKSEGPKSNARYCMLIEPLRISFGMSVDTDWRVENRWLSPNEQSSVFCADACIGLSHRR